jgi:hypothetical protein
MAILTDGWEILNSSDNFESFNDLSDVEKRIHHLIDNKGLPRRAEDKLVCTMPCKEEVKTAKRD